MSELEGARRGAPWWAWAGLALLALVVLAAWVNMLGEDADPSPGIYTPTATAYTRVGDVSDASYGPVRRLTARVIIPLGRTREEVTATLRRAAREISETTDASALIVFAFRPGDDLSGHYTVGRAVFAPNGRWEDAEVDAPDELRIELGELYFSDRLERPSAGDTIVLSTKSGGSVSISRSAGSWNDEDISGRVPSGTKAVVVSTRSLPLAAQAELMRVRVMPIGASVTEGWVNRSHIRPNP